MAVHSRPLPALWCPDMQRSRTPSVRKGYVPCPRKRARYDAVSDGRADAARTGAREAGPGAAPERASEGPCEGRRPDECGGPDEHTGPDELQGPREHHRPGNMGHDGHDGGWGVRAAVPVAQGLSLRGHQESAAAANWQDMRVGHAGRGGALICSRATQGGRTARPHRDATRRAPPAAVTTTDAIHSKTDGNSRCRVRPAL